MKAHGAEALEGAAFESTPAAAPAGVDGEGQLNGGHASVSGWTSGFLVAFAQTKAEALKLREKGFALPFVFKF